MSWQCPFCNQIASEHWSNSSLVSIENYSSQLPTNAGYTVFRAFWDLCPNSQCKEVSFKIHRYDNPKGSIFLDNGKLKCHVGQVSLSSTNRILPELANALKLPDYIPSQIQQDYYEACRIIELSPKASATLLRRCLQGMIRDFWGIKKARLIDEINALEEKEPGTKDLIDPIRSIGNIGAHMEADVNLIVDIEPEEAILLKEMIEQLIEDWYTERNKREQRIAKIKAVAAEKELLRKGIAV